MLQFRAETEEAAFAAERSALHSDRPDIRHAFSRTNVHHAKTAEIAVLRAERAVDDVHTFHQFRSQALERTEVSLAVTLSALILLHIVHQDFKPAADAAVIEVETEAANLQGFPPALVLPGVDAGVQDVEDLVVAGKEGAGEDFRVAAIDARFDGRGGNDDGGFERLDLLGPGGEREDQDNRRRLHCQCYESTNRNTSNTYHGSQTDCFPRRPRS